MKSLDKKKEYINKKDIIKYKIPVDKNFLKMFKDDDIFEITKPESLDKNKTKELEWEKEFIKKWDNQFIDDNIPWEDELKAELRSDIQSLLDQQKQQILNLECLKEEKIIDDTKVDCMILEKTWEDNDLKVIRNQLREEIIDEIKKL